MESAAQTWLTRQCKLIRGVTQGALVLADGSGLAVVARWATDGTDSTALDSTLNAALTRRQVATQARPSTAGSSLACCRVAIPISIGSRAGAVAVEVEDAKESELGPVVDLLTLGTGWLGVLAEREAGSARLVTAFELVGVVLEHKNFKAAATAVATDLAARLECERVSIGFTRKSGSQVEALSHSTDFDTRVQLIRSIASAMDEAVDQDAAVVYPPFSEAPARITREHEVLVQPDGIGAALTVPLAHDGKIIGAITLERAAGAEFDSTSFELCEDIAALLGPALSLQREASAGLLERCRTFLARRRDELREPGRATPRLVAGLALFSLAVLVFARGDYRVTAEATLEGRVQRAIVSGLDGYIAEANVRAGDTVRVGQVLAKLDDRDLLLEGRKWAGRRDQLQKEYREALALRDRAQVNIISAKMTQARAQLELLEENLLRTRLIAPFDGIVVRGDLSQSLGSPISRGDVLFEVAQLDGYRIILEVDERNISDIAVGQRGHLTLSALPRQPLPLVVERLTPVAIAEDGRNFFRVEARPVGPGPDLRPGMEGVAKLDVGRRQLIWIWTHSLVDWLRLWVWTWMP